MTRDEMDAMIKAAWIAERLSLGLVAVLNEYERVAFIAGMRAAGEIVKGDMVINPAVTIYVVADALKREIAK